MSNDILSQVRALKESGELQRMAGSGVAGLLARFALMVLEQKAIGCPYSNDQPVYALPPVPAPDDVEARAERAALHICHCLHVDYRGIDELKKIITAAIKEEV